ncbi:MAG: hypothetical protein COU07_01875 [Candidatus Harrisonbacteria bacterium CG10_big_fil_rev_8_21_14_0_10_40_38]|uniref:Hydrolase TatD n=1 Tax=Candidatus Harrisonbacteria bacterium CG10_big_fil_rev_8_21_14_0_10_40_38 TaxID=1974583 RepID=A0A2H0UT71_9BACT|nr:MAG: hypothetical protein COU07_01875 [Candidatus Harrisonbacteria bacterium CG10_big_fil_rev_8_21_14_0_10_40_38]
MIFDAHTHVQFPAYDNDRDAVISRARTAEVKMIAVGTQVSTSKLAIELAKKYPNEVWAVVGYHPNHADSLDSTTLTTSGWYHDKNEQADSEPEVFDVDTFRELAKNEQVVAIGECGLDYFRLATGEKRQVESVKEKQKKIFLEQVKIATEVNKPLMIHCRSSKGTDDAYEDLLNVLKGAGRDLKKVLHFYAGGSQVTKKFIDEGYYFTFGGVITFARDYDEIIKMIPMDRIMLETDAPYVSPMSRRGSRNEPSFIVEVAVKLSELKGLSIEETIEVTNNNVNKVFFS